MKKKLQYMDWRVGYVICLNKKKLLVYICARFFLQWSYGLPHEIKPMKLINKCPFSAQPTIKLWQMFRLFNRNATYIGEVICIVGLSHILFTFFTLSSLWRRNIIQLKVKKKRSHHDFGCLLESFHNSRLWVPLQKLQSTKVIDFSQSETVSNSCTI